METRLAVSGLVPTMCFTIASAGSAASNPLQAITGTYQGQGVECPLMRLSDGQIISLSGDIPEMEIGEERSLIGRWMRASGCMQGRNFQVSPPAESE